MTVHPEWSVPAETFDAVDLWLECRGADLVLPLPVDGGRTIPFPAGRLPGRFAFAGGAADQPNWLNEAFAVCERAWTQMERGET